jgi:hypothetical protein
VSSITFWTRIEAYTRLDDIEDGLQARLHDPLWLLARQWQTGEFAGEDAGTPVQARVSLERTLPTRYQAHGGAAEPYRPELPLEALVEREAVRGDVRVAAEAGLTFLTMLTRAGVAAATKTAFVTAFALAPADAGDDAAGTRYLSIMARRAPDGFRVYDAIVAAAGALPAGPTVPAADKPKVRAACASYRAWYEARYSTPSAPAWDAEHLEYSFRLTAPTDGGEVALTAAEYPGGTLDWYAFDALMSIIGFPIPVKRTETVVRTVLPAPVRYPGMASDRWWQFEDARVNLNRIEGDPDDLLRLALVDFSLLYSNDWFVVPVDLAPGGIFFLDSVIVTDAFGERTTIPHYSRSARPEPQWRVFVVSPFYDMFFLPPVLADSLSGEPVEEVLLMRDEVANVVWAVERLAPSLAGGAFDRDAAYRLRAGQTPAAEPAADGEALRYRLATTVPDNWIPFTPVRIDPSQPPVKLRRAAALLDAGSGPGFSRPRGRILEPDRPDFSLFEEEVPRAGARVTRSYQYARWVDGSTVLWLGRRKGAGRGEGSSGLRFDSLEDT